MAACRVCKSKSPRVLQASQQIATLAPNVRSLPRGSKKHSSERASQALTKYDQIILDPVAAAASASPTDCGLDERRTAMQAVSHGPLRRPSNRLELSRKAARHRAEGFAVATSCITATLRAQAGASRKAPPARRQSVAGQASACLRSSQESVPASFV